MLFSFIHVKPTTGFIVCKTYSIAPFFYLKLNSHLNEIYNQFSVCSIANILVSILLSKNTYSLMKPHFLFRHRNNFEFKLVWSFFVVLFVALQTSHSAHILDPPQTNLMGRQAEGGEAKPPIVLRRPHVNLTICGNACLITGCDSRIKVKERKLRDIMSIVLVIRSKVREFVSELPDPYR